MPSGGVPGTPLCRINHPAPPRATHNGATGLPREAPRDRFSRLQGGRRSPDQRGRRPPRHHRTTTLIGRRWDVRCPRRPGLRVSLPHRPSEPGFHIDSGRECPPKHCLAPTHKTAARSSFRTMIWSGTSVRGRFRVLSCGGVPGTPLCWINHPAPPRATHNGASGLPREAPRDRFSRLRRRPPFARSAWSTPSPSPPNDHDDWATLGRPTSQKAGDARRIAGRQWTIAPTETHPAVDEPNPRMAARVRMSKPLPPQAAQ